jgi:SAM-dependent methyltransferase
VVSQFALMYFADRVASLSEMWRTLAPAGRLAVAVWAPIDRAPAAIRYWWILRPDNAAARQQACLQRLSFLAMKPS